MKNQNLTQDEYHGHIETFLDTHRRFYNRPDGMKTESGTKNGMVSRDLPSVIRDHAEVLVRVYPRMIQHSDNYEENVDGMRRLDSNGNYGIEMGNIILAIGNESSEAIISADKVILNSVPLIDFVHYEIKKTIRSL